MTNSDVNFEPPPTFSAKKTGLVVSKNVAGGACVSEKPGDLSVIAVAVVAAAVFVCVKISADSLTPVFWRWNSLALGFRNVRFLPSKKDPPEERWARI